MHWTRLRWVAVLMLVGALGIAVTAYSFREPEPGVGEAGQIYERLLERRAALSKGSLRYEYYQFQTDLSTYGEMRQLVLAYQDRGPEPLRTLLANPGKIDGHRAHFGEIHYESEGREARVTRVRLEGFGEQVSRLQEAAVASGAKVILPDDSAELLYSRAHSLRITRANDTAKLVVRNWNLPAAPELQDIDMAFRPFDGFWENPTVPGQTITTFMREGRQIMKYITVTGDGETSATEYEFAPEWQFAPVRVLGTSDGDQKLEVCYGYSAKSLSGSTPKCSAVSHAKFLLEGQVRVQIWLVTEWREMVDVGDLTIPLPAQHCDVVDLRAGEPRLINLPAGLAGVDASYVAELTSAP